MKSVVSGLLVAAVMMMGCTKKAPIEHPLVHRDAILAYQLELPSGWKKSAAEGGLLVAEFRSDSETIIQVGVERINVKSLDAYWELLRQSEPHASMKVVSKESIQLDGHTALKVRLKGAVQSRGLEFGAHYVIKDGLVFQFLVIGQPDSAATQAATNALAKGLSWIPGISKIPKSTQVHADIRQADWTVLAGVWLNPRLGLRVDLTGLRADLGGEQMSFAADFEATETQSGLQFSLTAAPKSQVLDPLPAQAPVFQVMYAGQPVDVYRLKVQDLEALQARISVGPWIFLIGAFAPDASQAQVGMQAILDRFKPLTAADKAALAKLPPYTERQVSGELGYTGRRFHDRTSRLSWQLPEGNWNVLLGQKAQMLAKSVFVARDATTSAQLSLSKYEGTQEALTQMQSLGKRIGSVKFKGQDLSLVQYDDGVQTVFEHEGIRWMARLLPPPTDPVQWARYFEGLAVLSKSVADQKNGRTFKSPHYGLAFDLPANMMWSVAPPNPLKTDVEMIQPFGTSLTDTAGMVRSITHPNRLVRERFTDTVIAQILKLAKTPRSVGKTRKVGQHLVKEWLITIQGLHINTGVIHGEHTSVIVQLSGSDQQWQTLVESIRLF